ncbi:hypothetical protein LBW89_25820 [Paenibacillus sp. alder61]|uniref:hypothetical protein n=1 Tax=Paenibacillus sp. alder61 TaxID=2862948 RepID=UPI001CD1BA9A|nr:hypothetical protein [Paenibacillus sp. alder61]MCA1296432.1 hypothetical protein [Paenibacillus sp. alder61]
MKLRIKTVAGTLAVVLLAVFMMLSLPVFSSAPEAESGIERDAYETRQAAHSHKVILRLNSGHAGKQLMDRAPLTIAAACACIFLLLATPNVPFRPLFYLFKKRILLMPIKFTSMYVA